MERFFTAIAALAGAAAVSVDAAARHLLASDPARADLAATGARYGLVHAAALLALAALLRHGGEDGRRGWALAAGWCFVAALALFSGTLFLQAGGYAPGLTPLVPVGGTLFIAGWAALFVHAILPRRPA
jgi:uncharacterized membrane protein YgdD (TMEM256/DUF423 family)